MVWRVTERHGPVGGGEVGGGAPLSTALGWPPILDPPVSTGGSRRGTSRLARRRSAPGIGGSRRLPRREERARSGRVHGFVLQGAIFILTATEQRRIRQAFGDAPLEADLGDGPDATVEQRADIIRSLTLAAAALSEAYATASDTRLV